MNTFSIVTYIFLAREIASIVHSSLVKTFVSHPDLKVEVRNITKVAI